jgi:hypothetical protein
MQRPQVVPAYHGQPAQGVWGLMRSERFAFAEAFGFAKR